MRKKKKAYFQLDVLPGLVVPSASWDMCGGRKEQPGQEQGWVCGRAGVVAGLGFGRAGYAA